VAGPRRKRRQPDPHWHEELVDADRLRGGADLAGGSGLVGLKDRVEALGGRLWVRSPLDAGTTVRAELPLSPTRPIAGWPRAETGAIPDVS
jgi:signal transduction histidine kinase